MGSEFDSWGRDAGSPALTGFLGEPCTLTPKSGSPFPVNAIILREQLGTEPADRNMRVEYKVEAQIPIAEYPAPNFGGDSIAIYLRKNDTKTTNKKISSLVSQEGGMWHVRLD